MIKEYIIKSNTTGEEYSVILSIFDITGQINPEKSSCTCDYGSAFRFSKENLHNGKWKCAHIEQAIKLYNSNVPDEIQKEVQKHGEIKTKPIHAIFQ